METPKQPTLTELLKKLEAHLTAAEAQPTQAQSLGVVYEVLHAATLAETAKIRELHTRLRQLVAKRKLDVPLNEEEQGVMDRALVALQRGQALILGLMRELEFQEEENRKALARAQ